MKDLKALIERHEKLKNRTGTCSNFISKTKHLGLHFQLSSASVETPVFSCDSPILEAVEAVLAAELEELGRIEGRLNLINQLCVDK